MSDIAVTSQPGICAMRCTAGVPREPTPITPTRTLFIGATRKPCIGVPVPPLAEAPPPITRTADPLLMQPAAIAAAPIQAAPVKNSRLFWFISEFPFF
jgi:hypothetical protein